MKIEHLLKTLALLGNFHRRLPGEQGQDAHRFENAQHLVIGAELTSMRENAIVRSLHLFGDKPGERVEQSRLSHRGDCKLEVSGSVFMAGTPALPGRIQRRAAAGSSVRA